MSRPYVQYSDALARRVGRELRHGHTAESLPQLEGMPSRNTLYRWRREHPEFDRRFRDACAAREGKLRRRRGQPRDRFGYVQVCSVGFAEQLCARLIEGRSLQAALAIPGMPSAATVHLWLARHAWFRRRYAHALRLRVLLIADTAVEIADGL